jgi:predicted transcriptional regulator
MVSPARLQSVSAFWDCIGKTRRTPNQDLEPREEPYAISFASRRTTTELLKDILTTVPATKSGIRFTAGLSYTQGKRHVPYLIDEGYLQPSLDARGHTVYEISPRGRRLLDILNEIPGVVDD